MNVREKYVVLKIRLIPFLIESELLSILVVRLRLGTVAWASTFIEVGSESVEVLICSAAEDAILSGR